MSLNPNKHRGTSRWVVSVISIVLICIITAPARAAVYYVAPGGNDGWPGTEAQPWATVNHAAVTLVAGDTVYVKTATYYLTSTIQCKNSGVAGNPITFAACPGHTPVLDGTNIVGWNWDGIFRVNAKAYINIEGFDIRHAQWVAAPNAVFGVYVNASDHVNILRNHTYDTLGSGIYVSASTNIVAEGNEVELACNDGSQECISFVSVDGFEIRYNNVHHNGPGTNGGELIDMKEACKNGKCHHNLVHDGNRTGIYVDSWNKDESNIEVYDNHIYNCFHGGANSSENGGFLHNIRWYNNLIHDCSQFGIAVANWGNPTTHAMQDIYITNNTIYHNGHSFAWGAGMLLNNVQATNIVVRNNIFSQNKANKIFFGTVGVGSSVIEYNLYDGVGANPGTNFQTGSPAFVNPAANDYRLSTGSIAIDKGVTVEAVATDFDGNARPQGLGYDIGAYEYTVPGRASNPSPAHAATDVSVGADLSWIAGVGATSRNIYFGTANPPPFVANQTSTVYDPDSGSCGWNNLETMAGHWLALCPPGDCAGADINGDGTVDMKDFAVLAQQWLRAAGLEPNTTYYWRVDELNSDGAVTGDLWSFMTESPFAKDPLPADGTAELPAAGLTLSWTAPQSAASHNVYFGTSNPPPFAASQTSTQYAVLNTQYGTAYYWRIDEVLGLKSYTGPVWSFSTIGEPNDYLTGWWKLDETSGTTASDASGQGCTGTLVESTANSLTWQPAAGHRGGALKFDGDGPLNNVNPYCRLKVPTAGMSNNKGTICFWANLTDPAPVNKDNRMGVLYFFGLKGSATNDRIKLYVDDDPPAMRMSIGDYAYTLAGGYQFTRGSWYHIVIAWSGAAGSGNYVVYINGTALAPFSGDGRYASLNSLPAVANIGNKGESTYNQSFHGLMDDVMIYDRALTAEEIAALAGQ